MSKFLKEPTTNFRIEIVSKICADGILIKLLTFWTLAIALFFFSFKKQRPEITTSSIGRAQLNRLFT
jgi:hypothetical protein